MYLLRRAILAKTNAKKHAFCPIFCPFSFYFTLIFTPIAAICGFLPFYFAF